LRTTECYQKIQRGIPARDETEEPAHDYFSWRARPRRNFGALIAVARHRFTEIRAVWRVIAATSGRVTAPTTLVVTSSAATCTTGS
jgi:hypothetical protein